MSDGIKISRVVGRHRFNERGMSVRKQVLCAFGLYGSDFTCLNVGAAEAGARMSRSACIRCDAKIGLLSRDVHRLCLCNRARTSPADLRRAKRQPGRFACVRNFGTSCPGLSHLHVPLRCIKRHVSAGSAGALFAITYPGCRSPATFSKMLNKDIR
jgi:hypothetical protein